MSDRNGYDDEPEDDDSRRRAVWGLSVLVMVAVIVVTFMVLFTGGHEGGSNDLVSGDDSALSGALGAPSSSVSASTRPTHRRSSRATRGSGAVAQLAAGINQLRAQQHLRPVTAASSAAAVRCAADRGNGPTCVPHYMFAQLDTRDPGATLVALEQVNRSWLLDSATKRMEVGWAKLAGGGYTVAVLKFP